jgi:hypothetical protein
MKLRNLRTRSGDLLLHNQVRSDLSDVPKGQSSRSTQPNTVNEVRPFGTSERTDLTNIIVKNIKKIYTYLVASLII